MVKLTKKIKRRPKYRQPYSIINDIDISRIRRYNPALAAKLTERRHGREKYRARLDSRKD